MLRFAGVVRALPLPLVCALIVGCAGLAKESDEDDDTTGGTGTGGTGAIAGSGGSGASGGSAGTGVGGFSGGSSGTGSTTGGAGGTGGFAGSMAGVGGVGGGAGTGTGGALSGAGGGLQAGNGGSGGSAGSTGGSAGSGAAGAAGDTSGELGSGMMEGTGRSEERYATGEVSRDGVPYLLITNGWGPGFGDHAVSWNGTAFTVESMNGTSGSMGQPASYPSVFCGRYSIMQIPECGLPAPIDSLTTLRTGWRWTANGQPPGEYNAAYDIWLGTGTQLQGYLMVWLRDPPSYQPAGSPNAAHQGISVANVPGVWNVWNGTVNRLPITNYVRAEGMDLSEIEFDVMDFVRDAAMRGVSVPGTHVNAVAVGFEIWEGPVTDLESVDFYVHVN